MTRSVEQAVRASVVDGTALTTPTGEPFRVGLLDADGIVLLLGAKQARTRLPWEALEGVAGFLRGGEWVRIASVYSTESDPSTLDGYLKGWMRRATAGWVACTLEAAGVVEIDRVRPARVRLKPGF